MRRIAIVASALMIVIAFAGCASSAATQSTASSSASSTASASSSSASASASAASASSAVATTSLANPWSDVSSARDAAAGAQINGFSIPEGAQISLGRVIPQVYRYMTGIAEADVSFSPAEMTIRKGTASNGSDISGDYNSYSQTWTESIGGISIACAGNEAGKASKVTWSNSGYNFSITVTGGSLSQDDLNTLVQGIK